jgi:hypothetical protein
MKKFLLTLSALAVTALAAQAQTTVFTADFGTGYTDGNLVGQNGWTQTGTTATVAQTVSNGVVVLPSGATGQDTWNAFSSAVDTTVSGNYLLTTINFTLTNAPSASGDYFFHLSSPTNTTSNFYQRLFARSAVGGFQLGLSGNSAAASSAFGSTVLSLDTAYEVVIKWDFIEGTLNDLMTVYVDPTDPIITNNTAYVSTNWINTEPTTLAAANLRIGGSSSTPGVLVDSIEVQLVPEPSTYALLALAGAGFAGYVIRRRRR